MTQLIKEVVAFVKQINKQSIHYAEINRNKIDENTKVLHQLTIIVKKIVDKIT